MNLVSNFQSVKNLSQNKSDIMGSLASTLCLIHCLATPFLFAAHLGGVGHHHGHHHGASPFWWQLIDIAFLVLSFGAVYWSAQKSSKKWMKYALFISWTALAFVLFNEKLELFHLAEEVIYLPTLGLIGFHLYNRKYCQCEQSCEVENQ